MVCARTPPKELYSTPVRQPREATVGLPGQIGTRKSAAVARGFNIPAIGENSRLIQATVCMSNLLIREACPDDAPVLLAAEKETARTPGLLVSRPHEWTLQAFEQKIAELAQRGR